MLDIQAFKQPEQALLDILMSRGVSAEDLATLCARAQDRRTTLQALERLRAQQNQDTEALQTALQGQQHEVAQRLRGVLKENKETLKGLNEQAEQAENALWSALLHIPNLPLPEVPLGSSGAENQVVKTWGEVPPAKDWHRPHWELCETWGWVDFEQARKLSGARFAVMRGMGARLERALATFMLEVAREHGYEEISAPLLVLPEAMEGAGQFPKFRGEAFATQDESHVLIPTAEVPLVNLHRDSILERYTLPARYTAYTPCFRREAGAAGRDTRGLIRLHQFPKVELVSIVAPEDSLEEHERLTRVAETILERLRLPYRRVLLCRGDMGFAAAKTYDLEVWLPGTQTYREISSCSHCGDFQARRLKMRYRDDARKVQFVHTLNGSALAVGRTLVAVIENYQRQDGRFTVPEVLGGSGL